jgi:methyl-accepting chemotaxis protein
MLRSLSKKNDLLDAVDNSLAIIEFSSDGVIQNANENFLKTLGYSLNEIKGKHHSMFVDPNEASSQKYQEFWQKLRVGNIMQSEFMRMSKGGKPIWIEASYVPVKTRNGQVHRVIKFATDITKRKIISLDQEGQLRAIDRSQAVIEFDLEGQILKANDNFLATLGYAADEIIGKHHSMFVEPDYRATSEYREFWKKLKGGDFFSAEYKRIGKGGKEVWIQASYNPIFDATGKPYKVVKYAMDITKEVLTHQRNALILKSIEDNLGDVNRAIFNAHQQTASAASASHQTSSNVQAVASAAEEMNASVEEIAQNMNKSRGAVDTMFGQVELAGQATQRLVSTAQSMSGIIGLIQDIAGQINLLALNATIESARAGEAGKGFAVVASEVKNLAGQTAKATEQIAKEIEGIQLVSKEAVDSLSTIRQSIEMVREYVTNVAGAIEEQSAVMRDISSNMQVASMGVSNVSVSVSEVASATEVADLAARRVLEASLGLAA